MAIWYVDYVNGSSSNGGTSWADAAATIAQAITLASSNDSIHVAKSPDPISTGIDATWTSPTTYNNFSKIVTPSSACNKLIDDCDVAWTAKTNVTCGVQSTRKSGSYSASISTNGSFTTGLMAYRSLASTLDLSQYQQISFWVYPQSAFAAGDLVLQLFSDAGVTVIASHALPAIPGTGRFQEIVLDFGGALPSNVDAIGIYAQNTLTSKILYVDNVVACLPPSNPACITHRTLLSKSNVAQKNPEGWYPIQSINDTAILLDGDPSNLATAGRGYFSIAGTTTETVPLYVRNSIAATPVASAVTTIYDCTGKSLDFQGGWNTSTNTQDGETWLDFQNGYGSVFLVIPNQTVTINYFGIFRANYGIYINNGYSGSAGHVTVPNFYGVACSSGIYGNGTSNPLTCTFGTIFINNCGSTGLNISGLGNTSGNSADAIYVLNCNSAFSTTTGYAGGTSGWVIGSVYLCNGGGDALFMYAGFTNSRVGKAVIQCNVATPMKFYSATNVRFGTLITGGNQNTIMTGVSNATPPVAYVSQATIPESTIFTGSTNLNSWATMYISKLNGSNNHWIFTDNGSVNSQNSVVHTAGGLAWNMVPATSARSIDYPLIMSLGKVIVQANLQVTCSVWMQKSTLAIGGRLMLRGYQISGVDTDIYADCSDSNVGAWEQVSITFTPTDSGVIELECWSWYKTDTGNLYVDDLSVTQ